MILTIREAEEMVQELEPTLLPTDDGFKEAALLLASTSIGTDVDELAAFTGYDRAFISKCAEYLRASGVWTEDGMLAADWWDEEMGTIAFWLDVNIAQGFIVRT